MLFPTGSIPTGPPIESKKALLLVDFQNEFVDQDNGKLPIPNVDAFVAKLPCLVAKFRSKGLVAFVRTRFEEPRSSISPELACHNILLQDSLNRNPLSPEAGVRRHRRGRSSGTLKAADPEAFLQAGPPERRICIPDTSGVEHCALLAPTVDLERDLDIVKSHYSAFTDTPLLTQLRTRMIQHVYIAGALSNVSVYATVLDAVRHGMEVTIIDDCLGYRNAQCHEEAVRQMADMMGALGTDHQELMDDLAGLLGDVIREEDFSSRFQVSVGPPAARQRSAEPPREPVSPEQRKQRVEEWIQENEPGVTQKAEKPAEGAGNFSTLEVDPYLPSDSRYKPRSHILQSGRATPEFSPPRKRSTHDLDDDVDDKPQLKTAQKPSSRRAPPESRSESSRYKVSRTRLRSSRPSREATSRPITPASLKALGMSVSPGEARGSPTIASDTDVGSRTLTSPTAPTSTENDTPLTPKGAITRSGVNRSPSNRVGPAEMVGEGDCFIRAPIVPTGAADTAFYTLKRTVQWQKMYHRSGEVPRLVAVQGDIDEDDESEPIYRHPADESPEMLPFDNTVNKIRAACEKNVGHPLNHVLIQYYRSGEDNISEHSDKSLDIVPDSSIVNFSLGAQRIMTIRTKKDPSPSGEDGGEGPERRTQRIPLMHNSIFVLGQITNQFWLHSVRADKRPTSEKGVEELAYDGERISLTFRQIGTFVNKRNKTIWGQGATGKTKEEAKQILEGDEAAKEGEAMIRAFGQENHQSATWDRAKWYEPGFDTINFETKAT